MRPRRPAGCDAHAAATALRARDAAASNTTTATVLVLEGPRCFASIPAADHPASPFELVQINFHMPPHSVGALISGRGYSPVSGRPRLRNRGAWLKALT